MPTFPKAKKNPWLVPQPRVAHGRRRQPNQKFYNSSRWRKAAKSYERKNPICEECRDKGIITDATGRNGVTDHVVTVNDAMALFKQGQISKHKLDWYLYHEDNQRRLCNRCHNSKSGKEAHK